MEDLGGMVEVRVRPGGPAGATTFQWQDMLRSDLMLMSLANHHYLLAKACAPPTARTGPVSDGKWWPANSRELALIRASRPCFGLAIAGRSAWFQGAVTRLAELHESVARSKAWRHRLSL